MQIGRHCFGEEIFSSPKQCPKGSIAPPYGLAHQLMPFGFPVRRTTLGLKGIPFFALRQEASTTMKHGTCVQSVSCLALFAPKTPVKQELHFGTQKETRGDECRAQNRIRKKTQNKWMGHTIRYKIGYDLGFTARYKAK